ncbi:OsmC family protein [Streptosporangium sandarakinum]|uniref:OsmC family protein n=1 Tax=Streptosporangium sandarakinum TaxID=1260955 RepID=UPI00341A12BB
MEHDRNGVVRLSWRGGDRFDLTVRRHVVRVDQTSDFRGSDTGPTPVELFVGSLAASVAQCAERYLHRCQLPAGVSVTARFDLDVRPEHASRVELVVEVPDIPHGLRESFANALDHSTVPAFLRVPPEIDVRVRETEPGSVPGCVPERARGTALRYVRGDERLRREFDNLLARFLREQPDHGRWDVTPLVEALDRLGRQIPRLLVRLSRHPPEEALRVCVEFDLPVIPAPVPGPSAHPR